MECRDRTAVVTLNRPEVLNALNPQMALDLDDILAGIAVQTDVRSVILRGAGAGFMAGGDIAFFETALPRLGSGRTEELAGIFDHVHGIVRTLRNMPQPVMAQVHGAVAGFGLSLMMACDLVMAAAGSQFTLAYCHLGTSPDGGSTYALPRITGLKRAMELALLGDRFDAARAQELGLVNWVVADDELEGRSGELAARLARGPARAYAHTKRLINSALNRDLADQLDDEKLSFMDCARSRDFAEGVTAFVGKRPPQFGQD